MVGPSITDEERRVLTTRLKAGFALLVALSGALTGLWAGGTVVFVAGGALAGGVLGGLLVAYLSLLGREARSTARRRAGGLDDREAEGADPPESREKRRRKRP